MTKPSEYEKHFEEISSKWKRIWWRFATPQEV